MRSGLPLDKVAVKNGVLLITVAVCGIVRLKIAQRPSRTPNPQ